MRSNESNITPSLDSFVGRADELSRLTELVANHRAVVVVGPSGAGKTRLSRELALRPEVADLFDAAWFCDLSAARDAHDLVDGLCDVLGIAPRGSSLPERATSLATQAGARPRSLVILDNFETVIDDASSVVREWASQLPHAFLITSTAVVDVRGFQHLHLGPLGVEAAAQLFMERGYLESGKIPVPDDASATARIVERLDYLPLAVELAARHTDVLSAPEIESHLDRAFELLTSGPRDAPARHASLAAMVGWGWSRLGDDERELMEAAAVFEGSFSIEDLAFVADIPTREVRALVQSLSRRSMITPRPGRSGVARVALLHTLRAFALERLSEAPQRRQAYYRRHLRHYADAARGWLPSVNRDAGSKGPTEPDRANVVAALRRAVGTALEPADFDAALQLGLALRLIHDRRGVVPDCATLLRALLGATGGDGNDSDAHILLRAETGELLRRAGDPRGEVEVSRAVEHARATGSDRALSAALVILGEICFIRGDQEAGLDAYEEALDAALRVGDARLELDARQSLAAARSFLGPVAIEEHEKILALAVAVGDDWVQATTLTNLGLRLRAQGKQDAAIVRFRASIERLTAIGDEATAGHAMLFLGVAHLNAGQLDEADQVLATAKSLLSHRGPEVRNVADIARARVLIARGDEDAAEVMLGEILARARAESAAEVTALAILERCYLACRAHDEERLRREIAALPELAAIRSHEPRQQARALRALVADLDVDGTPALDALAEELHDGPPAIRTFIALQSAVLHLVESWSAPDAAQGNAIRQRLASLPCASDDFHPENIYDLRRWLDLLGRSASSEEDAPSLAVRGEFAAVRPPGGEWIDLQKKGRTRAVIRVLVRQRVTAPGTPISSDELFRAAWPDTTIRHESAMARVYTAMSEIRKMGLDDVLVRTDLGYLVAAHIDVTFDDNHD